MAHTEVVDNFNRTDAADLGGNWTAFAGSIGISANRARTANATLSYVLYTGQALSSVNQRGNLTTASNTTGNFVAMVLRSDVGMTSYYYARLTGSALTLYRFNGGASTQIATAAVSRVIGGSLVFSVIGTGAQVDLSASYNGVTVTGSDASGSRLLTGLYAGMIMGSSTDVRVDPWGASDIPVGGAGAQVTVFPAGAGRKFTSAGAGAVVSAACAGGGRKRRTSGVGSVVQALASGSGRKRFRAGIGAEVSCLASGSGRKRAHGSSGLTVTALCEGQGRSLRAGGAGALVQVAAAGRIAVPAVDVETTFVGQPPGNVLGRPPRSLLVGGVGPSGSTVVGRPPSAATFVGQPPPVVVGSPPVL